TSYRSLPKYRKPRKHGTRQARLRKNCGTRFEVISPRQKECCPFRMPPSTVRIRTRTGARQRDRLLHCWDEFTSTRTTIQRLPQSSKRCLVWDTVLLPTMPTILLTIRISKIRTPKPSLV